MPRRYVRDGHEPPIYWTYPSFIRYLVELYAEGRSDMKWMEEMRLTEVDELPPGERALDLQRGEWEDEG